MFHFTYMRRGSSYGRMKKIVISWIICVLALVWLLVWVSRDTSPQIGKPADKALITADFTLQDGKGKTVRATDFRGRYLLVYFGFTHCPDICPTTLLLMQNALSKTGAVAKKIQPVFITVDPERDTPEAVADYAGHFGASMIGLSGTAKQIRHAADSFKVYYSKVEDKGSALGYVVDHSGFIYLMAPDGSYVTHFAATVSEQELQKELISHVR